MDKMTPSEVPLTNEIAKRMGFVNLKAMENYEAAERPIAIDKLLLQVCNQGQMILEMKQHIEELERRLVATGTERIG